MRPCAAACSYKGLEGAKIPISGFETFIQSRQVYIMDYETRIGRPKKKPPGNMTDGRKMGVG